MWYYAGRQVEHPPGTGSTEWNALLRSRTGSSFTGTPSRTGPTATSFATPWTARNGDPVSRQSSLHASVFASPRYCHPRGIIRCLVNGSSWHTYREQGVRDGHHHLDRR